MKPTTLELHCLDALCDDYENISSVRTSVIRTLGEIIDENQVWNCILNLTANEWSCAYLVDENGKYCTVKDAEGLRSKGWFLITDKGRQVLNENWIDDEK